MLNWKETQTIPYGKTLLTRSINYSGPDISSSSDLIRESPASKTWQQVIRRCYRQKNRGRKGLVSSVR